MAKHLRKNIRHLPNEVDLIAESIELLELFDRSSGFAERCNEIRQKWGLQTWDEYPFISDSFSAFSAHKLARRGAYILERQMQIWENPRRQEFLEDIASLCSDFGFWYPTWKSRMLMLLSTHIIPPPTHDFILRIEERPEDDPWKVYSPNRVVIELSDTTTGTALKDASSLLTEAQGQAFKKKRIVRKHAAKRLEDYASRILRANGLSMDRITRVLRRYEGTLRQGQDLPRGAALIQGTKFRDRERKRRLVRGRKQGK